MSGMDNGIYITLSRQLALFRDMNMTANNLANANTTGFGAEHIMFNSYLNKDVNQRVQNNMSFANDISSYRNLENGPMQVTNNQLDAAIKGNGYFSVETPQGTRYTRAGNFQIAGDGTLMNASGHPVLDPAGQRIVFPDNVSTVEIGSVGNLKVNGDDFGAIGVHAFENEQAMEQVGHGLYKTDALPQPTTATVVQGILETSNVQPVIELTHMIDVSRSVASTAKYVAALYELQRKAADVWTRQG